MSASARERRGKENWRYLSITEILSGARERENERQRESREMKERGPINDGDNVCDLMGRQGYVRRVDDRPDSYRVTSP